MTTPFDGEKYWRATSLKPMIVVDRDPHAEAELVCHSYASTALNSSVKRATQLPPLPLRNREYPLSARRRASCSSRRQRAIRLSLSSIVPFRLVRSL